MGTPFGFAVSWYEYKSQFWFGTSEELEKAIIEISSWVSLLMLLIAELVNCCVFFFEINEHSLLSLNPLPLIILVLEMDLKSL